ncbi:putative dehydrogenase [Breznakia blatticola]|uniref:Putative dehydrogenase n=1 Tax=Breznakia blatticola TaxID=1754012 RepID=A0A4R7ZUD1_9FIRM|nr:Gfo/Idh/MocA family oxidoreductase [Breznakia blatticola]TDW20561.1 putative dehydrogenase [Breznakia blatticola]
MNVAILGLGGIAKRVALGVTYAKNASLYAVAARDIKRAQAFQEQYDAVHAYGSYDEVLADPQVELVYICVPNALHYDLVCKCLQANKHVICEKIMVTTHKELKQLFDLAKEKQCFLMEANKTVFTPLNQKLYQMIANGVIGKLQFIKAEYSARLLDDPLPDTHWVLDPVTGGCAFDIGVYPTCFAHYYANSKVKEITKKKTYIDAYACDFGLHAMITYENGIQADIMSNWLYTPENKGCAYLIGEKGYIKIPAYWKEKVAYIYVDGKEEIIAVDMQSDFSGEIEHAVACIEHQIYESPIMGYTQSKAILEVVD